MLKLIEAPTIPPYDLDKLKTYLRVLDTHQDEQIKMMADTYVLKAEEITNLVLQGISTFEYTVDGAFREIVLPKNPVTEIVKVEYLDESGTKAELPLEQVEYKFPMGATKTPFTVFFIETLPKTTKFFVTFKAGFEQIDSRVEMYLNIKVMENYDNIPESEASAYTDRLLDSLRVNWL